MVQFICRNCLPDKDLTVYGKCRLLYKKSNFDPTRCPFDVKSVAKWVREPQSFKVVKQNDHTTKAKTSPKEPAPPSKEKLSCKHEKYNTDGWGVKWCNICGAKVN